jgi:hypothetical protein
MLINTGVDAIYGLQGIFSVIRFVQQSNTLEYIYDIQHIKYNKNNQVYLA